MTLWEELYFEITLKGKKKDLEKFVSIITAGELEEFFEVEEDYIMYGDNYEYASDEEESEIIFANDDYGIEIERICAEDLLDVFCTAAKPLDVYGSLYDSDGNEMPFTSDAGNAYYINPLKASKFNDELDAVALEEEENEDGEDF